MVKLARGTFHGDLAGIGGTFHLTVEDDGAHRYELEYEISPPILPA